MYCLKKIFSSCFIILAFSCFFAGAAFGEGYDPEALYLTWQRSPESTMTIRWITEYDRRDDIVEYRGEATRKWAKAEGFHWALPGEAPYLVHSVELTNLLPNTTYWFRIGSDGISYKFQTMPDVLHGSIRFVCGGDMYHDSIEYLSATNRQAAKTGPLFALVGGDIAYAGGKAPDILPQWTHPWVNAFVGQKFDRWLSWLIAWKNDMVTPDGRLVPILPVLGNHDTDGRYNQLPAQAPFFYSLFAMPGEQGYNVLDFGNYMSLFLLDSGHTHSIDGEQAVWLSENLESRQNVPHKFALYHVPAFPSIRSFNYDISVQIRKHWVPSFDKYRLTAAFENHDHAYKRTHPLRWGKIDPQGVVYLGDGAWGVEKPRKPRSSLAKPYFARTASARHFILMVVEPDRRYSAAISSEGKILDESSW